MISLQDLTTGRSSLTTLDDAALEGVCSALESCHQMFRFDRLDAIGQLEQVAETQVERDSWSQDFKDICNSTNLADFCPAYAFFLPEAVRRGLRPAGWNIYTTGGYYSD